MQCVDVVFQSRNQPRSIAPAAFASQSQQFADQRHMMWIRVESRPRTSRGFGVASTDAIDRLLVEAKVFEQLAPIRAAGQTETDAS